MKIRLPYFLLVCGALALGAVLLKHSTAVAKEGEPPAVNALVGGANASYPVQITQTCRITLGAGVAGALACPVRLANLRGYCWRPISGAIEDGEATVAVGAGYPLSVGEERCEQVDSPRFNADAPAAAHQLYGIAAAATTVAIREYR